MLGLLEHIHQMKEGRLAKKICNARTLGKNEVDKSRIRWKEQTRKTSEKEEFIRCEKINTLQDRITC